MGLGHSPKFVTDGLILLLDPANVKNFNLSEVEVLVVAGGGGGGSHHGGGGGAGGLIYSNRYSVTSGTIIPVFVGSGGTGGTYIPNANGGNGANSVFGNLTAIGGGGGATYPNNGNAGGSGGGPNNWSIGSAGGAGTAGQGFSAATNNGTTNYGGGGGGAGSSSAGQYRNAGGNGLFFPQFSSVAGSPAGWFAGGGGSGTYPGYTQHETPEPLGGVGGGGNGGNGPHNGGTNPTAGAAATGGGGGGVADLGKNGAAGGSGIVIVRYPGPQKAIGGTISFSEGHTYHVFSTVGSSSFLPLPVVNNFSLAGIPDLSGQNNFGTVFGTNYNNANGGNLVFDGIDDYIDCGTNIQLSTNFTLDVWHKNINTGFLIDQGAIGTDPTGSLEYTNRGLSLAFNNSEGITANGSFSNVTVWNHVATSFYSGTIKFYINGVLDSTKTSTNISFTPNGNLKIGRRAFSNSSILSGTVGPVKIYNRVLTDAEVRQNFNALRGRFGV